MLSSYAPCAKRIAISPAARAVALIALVIAILGSFAGVGACAEANLPVAGDALECTGAPVAIREAFPDATIGATSAPIGWIRKGDVVRVIETKQYVEILGTEIWLNVRKQSDNDQKGWVMAGTVGKPSGSWRNLSPHRAKPELNPADQALEDLLNSPKETN